MSEIGKEMAIEGIEKAGMNLTGKISQDQAIGMLVDRLEHARREHPVFARSDALAFRVIGCEFDELYQATVIRAHDFIATIADWADRWLIAGLVVRGTHGTTELIGRALRLVQTGNLQTYAFLFALGVAFVLWWVLG